MERFEARIYKTGINAAVDVPGRITGAMAPAKGYIRVTGTINGFAFRQTLVPVKGAPYRLFVNIPMLKGGNAAIGDTAAFALEQDHSPVETDYPMNEALLGRLTGEKLLGAWESLTPSRKKDILKYLHSLKTEAALQKNISKVAEQLKNKAADTRIP